MANTNFSQTQTKVLDLILDLGRGDFERHIDDTNLTQKDLENHLRDMIKNDMLGGRTLYQAVRRNKVEIYEVTEELVNITIREEVMSSPFVENFCEVKDRGLGDTTEFYAEGGLLEVAEFAGNHWDTDRQALDIGEIVKLPKGWIYIHVYEELERFLLGIITPEKMMDKIRKSVNKYMQDRIFAMFNGVANAAPDEFTATGNDEDAVGDLVDIVQAAGGYTDITIAGTKGALRKLAQIVPDKMFANSQKEARAQTGSIGEWDGNTLMVIPQTLKSGTFEKALDDTKLYILDGTAKPIKIEFYGDTRTKSNTDGQENNDQTIDAQVQTKVGFGLVLSIFGVFTFQ